MSDTPRTDAAVRGVNGTCVSFGGLMRRLPPQEFVKPDFARELERENAALRSLLREAITEHVDPYDLPERDERLRAASYIARVKIALGEDQP